VTRSCAGRGHGPCDNARQRHHWVKQQRIRRVHSKLKAAYERGQGPAPWSLTKACADKRLWSWTCWRHHKPLEEGDIRPQLPRGFWDAVREYGLLGELPRWLQDHPEARER
jgi:hypothetical protein